MLNYNVLFFVLKEDNTWLHYYQQGIEIAGDRYNDGAASEEPVLLEQLVENCSYPNVMGRDYKRIFVDWFVEE